jgi:sarcosine oxidase subunit beta
MKGKILIVGGGAMGTCIAQHAAARCDPLREPVILIERDRLGAGASGRSGAIVHQWYDERALAGMARDAVKVYATMSANTGRSVGYRRTGVLVLAAPDDAEAQARIERDIEMQANLGINVRRVEAPEIRQIVPHVEAADGTLGAYEVDGGFIDPVRTIEAFATLARNRGAVTRIGVKNSSVLIEDGRAVGVETSDGTFYAPHVVLATGPWTPSILSSLGVDWPLRVVRTQEHMLKMPPVELADEEDDADGGHAEVHTRFIPDPLEQMPVAHPVVVDLTRRFHARCEPRQQRTRIGRVGFAGLVELDGPEGFADTVDRAFQQWARDAVGALLPVYRDMPDAGSHSSVITLTPDERPIIGPVAEIPGLFVVTGFSGNDFHLAPSIGEGVAQMLLEQPVSAFDPEFFSPRRFASASRPSPGS